MSDLPAAVEQLLSRYIQSVGDVDVLLLLRRTKGRAWTAEAAGRELRTSRESATARLEHLASKGFVRRSAGEYRYAASDELDDAVAELERAYAQYRTRVVHAIFG